MRIHFVGIGGIGVSALAKYYLEKGHKVSGSDLVSSEITEALKKGGAKITIPHQSKLGTGQVGKYKLPDLVIYSPAIPEDNPELREAKRLKIRCQSYPEALGELTRQYFTIAVSGTHGKSTTASMLGLLLVKAGFDPIVIIGTKLKEFGDSNCRVGKPIRQTQGKIQYLVIEADEHMASFLNYWPKIIVITNIEADHLDYYKNIRNLKKTFNKFISHLGKDGVLITDKSVDKKSLPRLKKVLKLPGAYNIYNASLVLAVARTLKIPDRVSFKALSKYKGAWRRFEEHDLKIKNLKLKIINDYGHHPTEIKVTLKAAREKYARKKIWCVYQPHQYQRTHYLFKDFVKVFREALRPVQGKAPVDKLIITDIYDVAGREEKKIKEKVNSQKLVKAINKSNAIYLPKEKIINYLKKNLMGGRPKGASLAHKKWAGEVVIIMGAGDIYNLFLELTRKKQKIK